jgi:thiol:disulfide interchange protein DsbA
MTFLFARRAAAVFCAFAALFSQAPTANAQAEELYPPQPSYAPAGKVEVIEFFNFSCPHCYRMLGPFNRWKREADPATIAVRRHPVVFSRTRGLFAQLYYTLEALGQADALYQKVFAAIHEEGKILNSRGRMLDWLETQGVERARAEAVFDSFAVKTKVERAARSQESYGVNSTPQIIVAGKYRLAPSNYFGYPEMMAALSELIAQELAAQQ